ncbi:MAG TPA: pitrilysin family protein [Alphaproteobacteria bacterium]|jgi:predicted Zn-dependent peptidase|nr:pitrilysin family protein [Alphaproteobacteria bacterium]
MTVEVTTLENGLRVATAAMPHVETVSLGVWVGVGTRDEPAEVNGVAHLLEHMAFKGTERRSARAIAEEIEAVGGHLNAYTSRESTAYFAKVLKQDVPLAVDIVADILQHSTFDESELAREREVVLQEIGQAHDTPDDIIFDYFQEAAFPDQPLGRPVLGQAAVVGAMPRGALVDYMSSRYQAGDMVLAAAGNVKHGDLVALAERQFTELPAGLANGRAPARYQGGAYREGKDLEQLHVVLGFPGISFTDPDYYVYSVYSTLLGGGMSSRLFQEVREKRGLAYSIYSFASSFIDGGIFGVYAGTGAAQVEELIPVIGEQMAAVGRAPGDAEIERARNQMKAGLLMSLESTNARSEQLANQLLVYGRPIPVEEIVARIDAVDAAAIRRMGDRLRSGPVTVAALGPIDWLESHDAIAARFA